MNCDYLYKTKYVQEYSDIELNLHSFEKEMEIAEVENGIILPPRMCDGLPWGMGGVIDDEGKLLKFSRTYGAFGKEYEYEKFNESHKDEIVYFCGLLPLHWGHFLIDYICRLYVLLENDKGYRIAYFSRFEDSDVYGNFKELLGYLGIGMDRFVKISEPTLFEKVIVPEPSMGYAFEFCAEKYRLVINRIKERALANPTIRNLQPIKKIYFTRMNFSSTDVGERDIAECFEKNGFCVLSPERLSLSEQVFYISNAEEIATVSGTIPHNFIFANPKTRLIYLNRNPLPNYAQFRINYIFGLNPIWIDVYNKRCLKQELGHNKFFKIWVKVSDCLRQYLNDNGMIVPNLLWMSSIRNYIRYHYIWDIHPILWKMKQKYIAVFHRVR